MFKTHGELTETTHGENRDNVGKEIIQQIMAEIFFRIKEKSGSSY